MYRCGKRTKSKSWFSREWQSGCSRAGQLLRSAAGHRQRVQGTTFQVANVQGGGQRALLAHVGPQRVAVGLRSGLSGAQRSRPATVGTRHRAPYFHFQAFRAHLWGALPLTISGTSQNTRPCRLTICMTARLATTIQTSLF